MMSAPPQDRQTAVHNGFTVVQLEPRLRDPVSGRHRVHPNRENAPRWLIPHTSVLTGRILRRWGRDTATLVESLIMPVVLLVTLDIVLGDAISQVTGHSALYGSVPLIALVGAMTGAMVGGVGLLHERTAGLLSRLWVLPVHRASGLLSRLTAEAVRIVVTTAVILGVGYLLGFRFRQGILEAIVWLFVPTVLGVAFSVGVITLALYTATTTMVELTEGVWALLMFFSTGFVPLDQFPTWVQPVVEHQPVSCAIETMRGLALGGPVLAPTVGMLLWSAGIVAACVVPMAVRYRHASMRN
jgi:ABC-2 type transport system permease protein